MVIEWVQGRLLRAVLSEQGKLPIERAVSLTLGICEALDYMHKHGVVHRDLKPENIMVDGEDRIKLIDFGIAMKEDARRLTYAGPSPLLGTPDYISPEQVKGQRGDQRSDIYALGIMLYEMLTGQTPFSGPNPLAVMNERVLNDPKPARKLQAGDHAPVAGDSLPRPGARPAPPLRNRQRDGLGAGASGAGGRGRGAAAQAGRTAAATRRASCCLYGCLALVPAGALCADAAAGAAVSDAAAHCPLYAGSRFRILLARLNQGRSRRRR